jgi:hypothetical protein
MKGEGTDGPWHHSIVMFFVRLNILSIFHATMFVVVDSQASDDCPRAKGLRHAKLVGKCVHPKHAQEDHFDDHAWRKVVKGSDVIGATSPFLEGADAALDVRNVLVFATDVQLGPEVGCHSASGALKFRVTEDIRNAEASFAVDAVDTLKSLDKGGLSLVVEDLNSNETYVSRNR